MTIEELKVLISAETSGLKKEIKNVQTQMTGLKSSVKRSTDGISLAFKTLKRAIIALGIGKAIKASIIAGMDAIESESLFEVSMGRMANSARKWSEELQEALGLNAYEIRKNVGVLYNMTTSMGLAQSSAYDLSKGLTELAYDMASFYNISNEEAFNKLRSGLTGETEPLKQLGILIDENTIKQVAYRNGLVSTGAELTQQQKVMARYLAIMEQTKNAQGDLARTIDSPANQIRVLRTQLDLLKINLGQAFMPIVQVVLPILTSLARWLVTVTSLVAQFSQALFGVSQTQNQQASATGKVAAAQLEAGEAIAEATEKAKASVAGFDEVNVLSESSADAAGGVGVSEEIPTEQLAFDEEGLSDTETKVQEFADRVKQQFAGLWSEINGYGSKIKDSFKEVGPALQPIIDAAEPVKQSLSSIGNSFLSLKDNTIKPIADYLFLDFIPSIVTDFTEVLAPVVSDIVVKAFEQLGKTFSWAGDLINTVWETVIKPVFDFIKDVVLDTLKVVKDIWDKHGADLLANIEDFIQGVRDTIQKLWDNVLYPIVQPFLNMLSWLWDKHIKDIVAKIGEFVFKAASGALAIYNSFIKPIVDWFITTLGPTVANVISFVIDVIGTITGAISDIVGGVFEVLGGLIDFIVGIFTGDWRRAWEGVKSIFKGVFDALYGIVKVPLNLIIDAINFVIRGLNKIHFDLPSWIPGIGGKSFGINIAQITKLARGGIIDQPTLAMVGEAGKEAVVPLENTSFVNTLATAVGNAVLAAMQVSNINNSSGFSDNHEIIVQLDAVKLARILLPKLDHELQRMGAKTIIQTT